MASGVWLAYSVGFLESKVHSKPMILLVEAERSSRSVREFHRMVKSVGTCGTERRGRFV